MPHEYPEKLRSQKANSDVKPGLHVLGKFQHNLSLFRAYNGLDELPKMCYEFPCKLIGKSAMAF